MDEETVRRIVREEIELSKNTTAVTEESPNSKRVILWVGRICSILAVITAFFVGFHFMVLPTRVDDSLHSTNSTQRFSENDFAILVVGDKIVDKEGQVWEVLRPLKEFPAASSNFFGGHGRMIKIMSLKRINDQLE